MNNTPISTLRRFDRVWHNLRRGMELAWTASPESLMRFTLLGIIHSAMPPVAVLLGARLVDQIAHFRIEGANFNALIPTLTGLWITAAVQRALGAYMGYGRSLFVRRVELEAERRLLRKAATVDLGHFDNSDWHDRLARAKRDVSWRPGDLTWSVLGLSGNLVTIVLMAGLLASLHYVLVILAIGASLISLALESRVTARLYEYYYKETPEDRERTYLGDILVQSRYSKELRANVLSNYIVERHRKITDYLFNRRKEMYKSGTTVAIWSGLVAGTTLALAYVFVAWKGVLGTIEPGGVVLVIGAFASVSSTLSQVSSTFVAVDQHTTFLGDYFSFLAIEPIIRTAAVGRPLPEKLTTGIKFQDVRFAYPGMETPTVHSLNLQIQPGELLALVGENGAGKSTIIKLLLRFYDVTGGSIQVGGVDIRDVEPNTLRSRIGVLFQDYATYEFTVRENLLMGRPDVPADEERMLKALQDSRSEAIVKKLPKGLDARVGRLFEGGHDLSGGEWQRLAIARMMYRDADIWILDEPTSSLDPEAEAAIFSELKANLRGRIGIVISHRFSTVRMADHIAVVEDGTITEFGSHESLLSSRGKYARLFELQASGYR